MFTFLDNSRLAGNYTLNSSLLKSQTSSPSLIKSLNKTKQPPKEFGFITLKVKNSTPCFSKCNIVGTIDRSGSMQDICKDSKTKMQHIHHTLKNIVEYLKNENSMQSFISLYGFDNDIATICENQQVDTEFQNNFPLLLKKLYPAGLTNIKLAIDKASDVCKKLNESNHDDALKTTKTIHLHLTDGNITVGEYNPQKIADSIYTDNCTNAFMGYGTEHSSLLLQTLAEKENGQYHFIDSLENAGMVYGEILHSCIYEQINSIQLNITNGLIYDYKTNTWKQTVTIPSMAADQTRTLHIKADDLNIEPTFNIVYQNSGDTELQQQQYTPVKAIQESPQKLELCWLRQLTQELMYEGQQIIKNKSKSHQEQHTCDYDTQKAHSILDYAKIQKWDVVWVLINTEPQEMKIKLLTALPYPRRFNLLHHAIHQNNIEQVVELMHAYRCAQKKVDLIPTRDNISVFELARGKHTILDILNKYKNTTTDSETPESPSQESEPDPFDIRINNFLEYLKEKKIEYENNHKNNESDENQEFIDTLTQLIDDTYITIRAQTSRLGNMYLRARAVTQATERAYNVADTEQLEATQTQEGINYRALLAPHQLSRQTTNSNASWGIRNSMNQCSKS